jgi:hypothetical protein
MMFPSRWSTRSSRRGLSGRANDSRNAPVHKFWRDLRSSHTGVWEHEHSPLKSRNMYVEHAKRGYSISVSCPGISLKILKNGSEISFLVFKQLIDNPVFIAVVVMGDNFNPVSHQGPRQSDKTAYLLGFEVLGQDLAV